MWGIEAKDFVIFIAGAVVAVIVGFVFYRLGAQKKRLNYSIERKLLVHRGREWPAELKLFYAETETVSLVHFRIFVWNGGNLPIVGNDLATASPPEFGLSEEVKSLHLVVSRQSRAANAVKMDGLQPKFEFLNVGDGFVVDLFAQAPEFSGKVWLKGDIVGADAPKEIEFRFAKSFVFRLFGLILLAVMLVLSALFGLIYFVDFPEKPAGAAIYSVGGLLLTLLAAAGLFNVIRKLFTRRIPRELLDENKFSLRRLRGVLKFGPGKMANEG
jgi:hypothetical protein